MIKTKILDETEEAILGIERYWLTRLQVAMAQFPATDEDRAALERSVQQLDELFLLVVVGEFNSGKSALINALFGEPLLETGVTPTTTRIHLLKHGKESAHVAVEADVDVISVPASLLEEITIVDTPGTNAIYREHEAMTREFLPRSDLVLFVTSVDRPFTESERAFLALIREWGKKVVVVLNKIDILQEPEDLAAIERFIRESAQQLLGFTPEVLPVSARLALKAKQTGAEALLSESRIEELESYIVDRLDERERVRLKLLNPVRVGLHLTGKYLQVIEDRLGLLRDDFAVIDNVKQQLATYRAEMAREFRLRLSDVDRELQAFENRGIAFFDETMRLAHFFDLLDRSKLEMQFREQAIADAPEAIESRVEEITAWLVERNQGLWQMVMESVRQRKQAHADRVLGDIPTAFDADRRRVIESVGMAAQQALQTYDRRAEAQRIAQSLQWAVASTALVEVGAVGLGTLITILASTTVLDVTGILAASTMAVLGFLVIPSRRRRFKNELREKIEEVRQTLMPTLTSQFETEVERGVREIEAAISPYTRFIHSQQAHWDETRDGLVNIEKWLKRQEGEIEAL
ncbi:MAG: dynamin family protein [Anaerolineae bacterium]